MTDVLITAVAFAGLLAAVLILAALAILAVSGYVDWHSALRMALLIEALRTEPAEIEADADSGTDQVDMVNKLAALLELARYHATAPNPRPPAARITYIEAATKEGERGSCRLAHDREEASRCNTA